MKVHIKAPKGKCVSGQIARMELRAENEGERLWLVALNRLILEDNAALEKLISKRKPTTPTA